MAAKFQQLPKVSEDIEMEWSLIPTVMISSAVESCGRKRFRMARGSEKRTRKWNRDGKKAIPAKKDKFKALLQNRSSSDLQLRYSEARKVTAQAVKCPKNALGRNLVVGWIPTIHRQTKYFGRPFAECVGKV